MHLYHSHINGIVIRRLGLYVILACVLSLPFTYLMADQWLDAYVFRIEIQWWMLGLPAVVLILIAITVVTSQSLKVFRVNPADVLKTE